MKNNNNNNNNKEKKNRQKGMCKYKATFFTLN